MMVETMRRACMWLSVVTACGRVHFDGVAARDGAASDGSTSDAFVLLTGPFTNVQLVPVINDTVAADDDPTLTADMLEIVFDSERVTGAGDLFSSTRADVSSPWSAPVLIAELSTADDEDGPCLGPDGLSMTFASDRPGGAGFTDLYETTRPTRTSPWATPVRIAELSSTNDEKRLCVSMDGLFGVFYSDPSGPDDVFEVRRSTRASAWEPAVKSEVSDSVGDVDPSIDPTGRVLVFASNRVAGASFDIYIATRATPDAAFSVPVAVDGINTAMPDSDPWLSPDFRTIVFTRGANAAREIYTATR